MVKFYFLLDGLRTDVERRYNDYLSGDSRKMQHVSMFIIRYEKPTNNR